MSMFIQKPKGGADMSKIEQTLEKATKLSDEYDPNNDEDNTDDQDLTEFDPDQEVSAGEDWLNENDPNRKRGDEYDEYTEDEDEDAHRRNIEEDFGDDDQAGKMAAEKAVKRGGGYTESAQASIKPQDTAEEIEGKKGRFRQPSKDEIMAMRAYTLPWEQRARDANALNANPMVNPVLAQQGDIIEARNKHHADFNQAHEKFINSTEFKAADPLTKMRMTRQFKQEWNEKHPDRLAAALAAHHDAHLKGKDHKAKHKAAKEAQIQQVIQGGAQGEQVFSTEEGMQHAGGVRGEEGTQGAIVQDPAAAFAMGNQDFIKQFAENYKDKAKNVNNIDDMMDFGDADKRDINRILGQGPSKDPKFEQFFAHYHSLIGMNASRVISKLGLDQKNADMSLLHEAGMHGLIQAINDYDHDHPSKASFATHASNKIRGLQMTAMRGADSIPLEMRQKLKQFREQNAQVAKAPSAPTSTVKPTESKAKVLLSQSKHPAAPDMSDRLQRVNAQRQVQVIRRPGGANVPPVKQTKPIGGNIPSIPEGDE